MKDAANSTDKALTDALRHLLSAIDLLDSAGAPGHIAAHVDLAASQLEELVGDAAQPRRPGDEDFGTIGSL